jgi:hypothetical protein
MKQASDEALLGTALLRAALLRAALLRAALRGNALFSTLTGLSLLLAAGALDPLLGVPALALRLVGLGLLPFAWALWRNAGRERLDRREAWIAVALDLGWVAGSLALVLADLWPLTTAGTWTVLGVAEVVFLCAVLQWVGLAKSSTATQPTVA